MPKNPSQQEPKPFSCVEITKLLYNSENLISDWVRLATALQLPHSEIAYIKKQFNQGTMRPFNLLLEIFQNWASRNGHEATNKKLYNVFCKEGFKDAAGLLANQYVFIPFMDNTMCREITSLRSYLKLLVPFCVLIFALFVITKTTSDQEWWIRSEEYLEFATDRLKEAFESKSNSPTTQKWIPFPLPTTSFVGREEELRKLKNVYKSNSENMAVITGLAGMGKSELAKKFAKYFQQMYKGTCLWLNGENGVTFASSLKTIVKELGPFFEPKSTSTEIVRVIKNELRNMPTLMIIDNYDHRDKEIENVLRDNNKFQPYPPFIIVTSRDRTALGSAGEFIALDVLPTEHATKLVMDSVHGEKIDEGNATLLSDTLHNFPLLLQQAIGFIKERRRSSNLKFGIPEYLKLLEGKKKDLYEYKLNVDHTYNHTTVAAISLTLDDIKNRYEETGARAIKLLQISVYLNPDGEFVDDLRAVLNYVHELEPKNYFPEKELELLERYSICTLQESKLTPKFFFNDENSGDRRDRGTFVSTHRLIQDVVRLKLSIKEEITQLDAILNFCVCTIRHHPINVFPSAWEYALKHCTLVEKYGRVLDSPQLLELNDDNWGLQLDLLKLLDSTLAKFGETFGWKSKIALNLEDHIIRIIAMRYQHSSFCSRFPKVYNRRKIDFGKYHKVVTNLTYKVSEEYLSCPFMGNVANITDMSVVKEVYTMLVTSDNLFHHHIAINCLPGILQSLGESNNSAEIIDYGKVVLSSYKNSLFKATVFLQLNTVSYWLRRTGRREDSLEIDIIFRSMLIHPAERWFHVQKLFPWLDTDFSDKNIPFATKTFVLHIREVFPQGSNPLDTNINSYKMCLKH